MKPSEQLALSPVQRLREYWLGSAAGANLARPANPAEVRTFEVSNRVVLPDDVREYLELVNGFDQRKNYQDERGFNFWPLEKLCKLTAFESGRLAFAGGDEYVLFCDYLDLSWAYAFSSQGIVMVGTRDGQPKTVAATFAQFVERYLDDDDRIYP